MIKDQKKNLKIGDYVTILHTFKKHNFAIRAGTAVKFLGGNRYRYKNGDVAVIVTIPDDKINNIVTYVERNKVRVKSKPLKKTRKRIIERVANRHVDDIKILLEVACQLEDLLFMEFWYMGGVVKGNYRILSITESEEHIMMIKLRTGGEEPITVGLKSIHDVKRSGYEKKKSDKIKSKIDGTPILRF